MTNDNVVVAGSDVGLFDLDDQGVCVKGRLGPGQMLAIDLEEHSVLEAEGIKQHLLKQRPKRNSRLLSVPAVSAPIEPIANERLQSLFGFTREDLKLVISPMAREGKEADRKSTRLNSSH